MRRILYTLLLVSLIGIGTAACGGGYRAPKPTATPTPAVTKPGEAVVIATYPAFHPSAITVVKGETIHLKITSTDRSHTFTIDELGINISVDAGQTVTKEIKVDKAGTFTFYCAVPGHRGAGMEGTLSVAE
ncbi:MAG: cupredoxin domain-containing protein [Dehalococcoidia bacterium]